MGPRPWVTTFHRVRSIPPEKLSVNEVDLDAEAGGVGFVCDAG
jgi:hypothetical protein